MYKNDQLYINGKAIEEPYLQKFKNEITDGGTLTEDFSLKDIPSVQGDTIPQGYVFVMGDNRRYSKDSRHIGIVSIDKIIGKTNVVFWPFEQIGKVN